MYEDSPEDLAYDLLTENVYKNDPLGMNIIGTEGSSPDLTVSSLRPGRRCSILYLGMRISDSMPNMRSIGSFRCG